MTLFRRKPRPGGLLLRLAGLSWEGDTLPDIDDLEQPALDALVEAASLYVAAGGVPTLSEWVSLGTAERAALVEARARWTASTVATMAGAVQSPAAAAEVASMADGGAARRAVALEEAAAAACVAQVRAGRTGRDS